MNKARIRYLFNKLLIMDKKLRLVKSENDLIALIKLNESLLEMIKSVALSHYDIDFIGEELRRIKAKIDKRKEREGV